MITPLRLLGLAFLLLAAVPSSIRAQCDPTLPECFGTSGDPPSVNIGHVGGVVPGQTVSLTVYYSDDVKVVSPPVLTLSGGTVTSHQFGYDDANDFRTARSNLILTLTGGTSVLQASITDDLGQSASASVAFQYTPPPPVQRSAPIVDSSVQNGVNRNLSLCDACSEAVLSHSTPAYVSLDQDRSVTLFYSANHADPRGFVWLDVTDPSIDPAQTITLQLRAPDGGLVQFRTGSDTMHFTRGGGINRIAGQFSAPTLATGSYPYTAVVTSRWSGQQLTTEVPVRVIVINERGNAAGAGWSIAGLQRVGTQADSSVFVTSGDGHLAFFKRVCDGSACTYESPPGDYTVLTRALVNGVNGWHRSYIDGTLAVFDNFGKLLHVTDRFGNRTSYTYNSVSGQLVSITDPIGKVTQLGYASGKLRTITDPTGRVTTLTHSGTSLVRIDDPTGAPVLRPTYSSVGRVTSWIDARGSTWNVSYDVAGKVATVYAPQITAEGTLLRPTTTVLTRERRALVSSTSGTATSPRAPIHPDSTFRRVTAPKGERTTIWGDAHGLATRIQTHEGKVTEIARYPDGRVRIAEDPDGNVAWYYYGSNDSRVTTLQERTASGSVTTEITYAQLRAAGHGHRRGRAGDVRV